MDIIHKTNEITIKGIIDCDTVNYKKISLVIEFPYCTFKCDKECGKNVCQNSTLVSIENKKILIDNIINSYYIPNLITEAIVCQGLEPFDSWSELVSLIDKVRNEYKINDDIVIYTGYTEEELKHKTFGEYNLISYLKTFYSNIIIKFGRYIPDQEYHFDDVIGVNLASDNQYAKKIS